MRAVKFRKGALKLCSLEILADLWRLGLDGKRLGARCELGLHQGAWTEVCRFTDGGPVLLELLRLRHKVPPLGLAHLIVVDDVRSLLPVIPVELADTPGLLGLIHSDAVLLVLSVSA